MNYVYDGVTKILEIKKNEEVLTTNTLPIYVYIFVCVSFSLLESELSACKHLHAYSDLKRSFSVIFVRRSFVGVSEVRRTKRALPSTFSSNVAKTKGKGKKGGGAL